jgi:hypothetical protein
MTTWRVSAGPSVRSSSISYSIGFITGGLWPGIRPQVLPRNQELPWCDPTGKHELYQSGWLGAARLERVLNAALLAALRELGDCERAKREPASSRWYSSSSFGRSGQIGLIDFPFLVRCIEEHPRLGAARSARPFSQL